MPRRPEGVHQAITWLDKFMNSVLDTQQKTILPLELFWSRMWLSTVGFVMMKRDVENLAQSAILVLTGMSLFWVGSNCYGGLTQKKSVYLMSSFWSKAGSIICSYLFPHLHCYETVLSKDFFSKTTCSMQEVPFDIEYKVQTQQLFLVMIPFSFFMMMSLTMQYAAACNIFYTFNILAIWNLREKVCISSPVMAVNWILWSILIYSFSFFAVVLCWRV